MAGRPSKLTPEIGTAIMAELAKGAYIETAVMVCRVPKRTFYDWMKRGKADEETGNPTTDYAMFALDIQVALAKVEVDLIQKLQEEKGQWTRYAWMLERRFWDRWALKKALEE